MKSSVQFDDDVVDKVSPWKYVATMPKPRYEIEMPNIFRKQSDRLFTYQHVIDMRFHKFAVEKINLGTPWGMSNKNKTTIDRRFEVLEEYKKIDPWRGETILYPIGVKRTKSKLYA